MSAEVPNGPTCTSCLAPLAEGGVCAHCGALVGASAPAADLAVGEIVEDTWRLEKIVGRGGMGTVFLATDLKLGRDVAVKTLFAAAATEELVQRFEREARVLALADHPNIILLHRVGKHRGVPFIVMKYLEGESLGAFVKARGGRLSLEEALPIARQLCAALDYVHQKGVVHRDLKPANIMVSPDGHVTVFDFGIARPRDSNLTRTGIVYGTPGYMAPELIVGEKHVDGRLDVYALGVILYEALTGQKPFTGQGDEQLLLAHIRAPRPDASIIRGDIPPGFAAALQKAMAVEPDKRFGSAAEFLAAMEEGAASADAGDAPTRPMSPLDLRSVGAASAASASAPTHRRTTGELPTRASSPGAALRRPTGEAPVSASSAGAAPRGATGEAPVTASSAGSVPRRATGEAPVSASSAGSAPRRATGEAPVSASSPGAAPRRATGEAPSAASSPGAVPRRTTGEVPATASSAPTQRRATVESPASASAPATTPRRATREALASASAAATASVKPPREASPPEPETGPADVVTGPGGSDAAGWFRSRGGRLWTATAVAVCIALAAVGFLWPESTTAREVSPLARVVGRDIPQEPAPEPSAPEATSDILQRIQRLEEVGGRGNVTPRPVPTRAPKRVVRKVAPFEADEKTKYGEVQITVSIDGKPVAADVELNGVRFGQSPVYAPVNPGPYSIRIHRRPYAVTVVPAVIKRGETLRLEVELGPYEG